MPAAAGAAIVSPAVRSVQPSSSAKLNQEQGRGGRGSKGGDSNDDGGDDDEDDDEEDDDGSSDGDRVTKKPPGQQPSYALLTVDTTPPNDNDNSNGDNGDANEIEKPSSRPGDLTPFDDTDIYPPPDDHSLEPY